MEGLRHLGANRTSHKKKERRGGAIEDCWSFHGRRAGSFQYWLTEMILQDIDRTNSVAIGMRQSRDGPVEATFGGRPTSLAFQFCCPTGAIFFFVCVVVLIPRAPRWALDFASLLRHTLIVLTMVVQFILQGHGPKEALRSLASTTNRNAIW